MKCLACNKDMMIIGNEFSSPKNSDVVSVQLNYGCTNPKCGEFVGNDTKKPNEGKVKKSEKAKVN